VDPELKKESLQYIRSIQSLNRAKALTFFHIPKTAGTAIEYAAGSANLAWGSCLFNHKPKRDICRYPSDSKEWPQYVGWWHVPPQFFPLAGADPYQGAELFAVVRDPYDRMVSEFYYICTLKVFDWRPDQCDRSRLLESDYMNAWLQNKLLSRRAELGAAQSYLVDNGHFTPQYDFLVGPHEVRMVDHVLRMEDDLNSEFTALMKAFKLSHVKLKKLNALGAEARGEHHLSVQDINQETLESIHQTYPRDFDLGYSGREVA
jgi:hypothetical protein